MIKKIEKRYMARELLLQILFQWDYTKGTIASVTENVLSENSKEFDRKYFDLISANIFGKVPAIDEQMIPFLSIDIEELNKVELAVLRLAAYELLFVDAVPFKVCIDQAAILNKKFGTVKGYKFVNAVLDAFAQQVRKNEYDSQRG